MNLSEMGDKIKAARTEKKLTLEVLSEKLGISRNFLWEIEAGRKAPAIQTLYNIGKELNISIDYLFGLSEKPKRLSPNIDNDIISKINNILTETDKDELKLLYKLLTLYSENRHQL